MRAANPYINTKAGNRVLEALEDMDSQLEKAKMAHPVPFLTGLWWRLRAYWRGMAYFNLAGQLPPLDLPGDEDAIRADWEAVGNDLRKAMKAMDDTGI